MDDSRIETLPDEILVEIFSYLSLTDLIDVVEKVSTRWKRLSQDPELWSNKQYEIRRCNSPDTDTCVGGRTDEEAIKFLRNAPNLRTVCMRRAATSRVFRALYTNCPRLSGLFLHRSQKLSYSVLKNLVYKCPQIRILGIPNELLMCERFSKAVSQLQQLQGLFLRKSNADEVLVLRPLGDGCPQLAKVDFAGSTLDVDDLKYFLNAKRNTLKTVYIPWTIRGGRCVLPLLTVCADSLQCLELYYFDIMDDEAREAFTALGSLKNLHWLIMSIEEPPPPGMAALAFKAGGLPKLRVLDLTNCSGLTDDTVVAVSRGCPALRGFYVSTAGLLTDAAFSEIHLLQRLEKLDLSHCDGLGGALVPCLSRLPRLHTLCMAHMDLTKLQPGLASIVQLSGLRTLTLDHSLITGVPFDKFPGKLLCLRELSVEWCRGDPKATEGLTELMPGLKINGRIEDEADGVQDGGSGSDGGSDDENSSSDSESDGEEGISDLFLERSVNDKNYE